MVWDGWPETTVLVTWAGQGRPAAPSHSRLWPGFREYLRPFSGDPSPAAGRLASLGVPLTSVTSCTMLGAIALSPANSHTRAAGAKGVLGPKGEGALLTRNGGIPGTSEILMATERGQGARSKLLLSGPRMGPWVGAASEPASLRSRQRLGGDGSRRSRSRVGARNHPLHSRLVAWPPCTRLLTRCGTPCGVRNW